MDKSILQLLQTRRSHFRKEFTGEKASDGIVNFLLECAHQAPSHRLTLPWLFKIFKDESLNQLRDKILEIYYQESDLENNVIDAKAQKIMNIPKEASHVIAICVKRDKEKRVPQIEEICATAAAVENIYIGLLQFDDIGGYWCTGNGAYTKQMHNYLELDEDDLCLGFFFIGKLKAKRTEANRPPYSQNIKWMS